MGGCMASHRYANATCSYPVVREADSVNLPLWASPVMRCHMPEGLLCLLRSAAKGRAAALPSWWCGAAISWALMGNRHCWRV